MPATLPMLLVLFAACGHDATNGADVDGSAHDSSMGCPAPVSCPDGSNVCDVPPPSPGWCMPLTDFARWTECSNGYIVVTRVAENSGVESYYRDGKLVAVYGGHLSLTCWSGPADFVRPDCMAVRSIDLCDRDAAPTSQ